MQPDFILSIIFIVRMIFRSKILVHIYICTDLGAKDLSSLRISSQQWTIFDFKKYLIILKYLPIGYNSLVYI